MTGSPVEYLFLEAYKIAPPVFKFLACVVEEKININVQIVNASLKTFTILRIGLEANSYFMYRLRSLSTVQCTLGGFNFILFWNFNRNQTEIDR